MLKQGLDNQNMYTTYFGNEAQNNVTNYDLGGPVLLYEYDASTATYSLSQGTGPLTKWANVEAIFP